jgi:EamA-like transporter family
MSVIKFSRVEELQRAPHISGDARRGADGERQEAEKGERAGRALIFVAFGAVYLIWGSTYLGIKYAIIAFTAYSWLLRTVSPARAATYAYVNPIVAVIIGWALASEPLTIRIILAAGVIVGSVVLINYGSQKRAGGSYGD